MGCDVNACRCVGCNVSFLWLLLSESSATDLSLMKYVGSLKEEDLGVDLRQALQGGSRSFTPRVHVHRSEASVMSGSGSFLNGMHYPCACWVRVGCIATVEISALP